MKLLKRVQAAVAGGLALTLACWSLGCGAADPGEFREFTARDEAGAGPEFRVREQPSEPGGSGTAGTGGPQTDGSREAPAAKLGNGAAPSGDLAPVDLANDTDSGNTDSGSTDSGDPDAGENAQVAPPPRAPSEPQPRSESSADEAEDSAAEDSAAEDSGPREIKLLVPDRSFQVEGPDGAWRVSYDDIDLLKVLNMEPVVPDCVDYFPQWLKDLDGRRIRIRGFMVPPFQETNIPFFVLARDNEICCFGRDPKRYDVIDVLMRDGVRTNYIQGRPFDVVGTFHIRPEASGGELYQLYVIEDAIVIDR